MKSKYLLSFLFCFLILKVSSEPVIIDGSKDNFSLNSFIYFFVDSTGRLGYSQVSDPTFQGKFIKATGDKVPYEKESIWIKFSVENATNVPYVAKIGLTNTLYLDVYRSINLVEIDSISTGILRPKGKKEEQSYYFIFSVPKGKVDYWVRVETWPKSFVPIEVVKRSLIQSESNFNIISNGVYIGVVLLILAFCFYYYLIFKELIYLMYMAWVFSTSLFMFYINGFFNEYIAQINPQLNLLYPASLIISTFFYFVFIITYLQLKKYSKFFYWIFYGFAIIQVFLLAGFFVGFSIFEITQSLGSIFNLLVLVSAIIALRKGHSPAKYLIMASLVVFVGGATSLLAINNVIPLTSFTANALQYSLVIEIFLFTMGLVGKSFSLKKEIITTQTQIIEVMHENERIINENRTNLERVVKERTKEIEEQNHELKQQHEELKLLSERVHEQNELLDGQNIQLKNYNDKLEERVEERTQQLKLSSEKLLEQYRKLEQYNYITSHNLRGPIARLLGLYNILDKNKIKDTENEVIINHMQNTALAMDSVVKDLAKILEINNKKNDDLEEIELVSLFETIKETLNLKEVQDLKLTSDFSQAPTVISMKPYIQSIFYNLLSNSIKYRFPFRALEINVISITKEDGIVIKFSDNGLGIDLKSAEKKLFQPFQRFHDHQIDGSGFGLFLVRLQVDNLGGDIEIESEPNVGTTISVFLPFEKSVPID